MAFTIDKGYTSTFNAATKAASKKSPFSLVKFKEIEANENNFYSIEDIDSLKYSIKTTGLQEPPVVLPKNENGRYTLLSGERRWTAIRELIKEGNSEFEEIYVKILNPDDLDLPLSYEEKVKYLIVAANSHRNTTNEDILNEMKTLRGIYASLKSSGAEVTGNLRPFIAEALGMSETQVQRYSSIEKHLRFEFFDMFCKDILPISVAANIAKLSPGQQKSFYNKVKGESSITQAMLDSFVQRTKQIENAAPAGIAVSRREITKARKNIKAVLKILNSPISAKDEKEKTKIEEKIERLSKELESFANDITSLSL